LGTYAIIHRAGSGDGEMVNILTINDIVFSLLAVEINGIPTIDK